MEGGIKTKLYTALFGSRTCWSLFFFLTCMYYISFCCICLYCRYLELIFMIDSCNVLWDDVDVWASQPEVALTENRMSSWLVWLWADNWELVNLKVEILQCEIWIFFFFLWRPYCITAWCALNFICDIQCPSNLMSVYYSNRFYL